MVNKDSHPSDEELLLAADAELPARSAIQVRAHLAGCWDCRARMAEIEGTIVAFSRVHRQSLDPQLPSIDGPRAKLRAQLGELESKCEGGSMWQRFQFAPGLRTAALLCAAVFFCVLGGTLLLQYSTIRGANSTAVIFEAGAEPDHSLTPGATRRVTISDVCSMTHEEVVAEVPTSLRQKVFQEYGIVNANAGDYEIDYLIAPGLGGVEAISNLWPEPYTSRTWNAHVKDALEERLHEMVCAGQLDLSTAQRDIAADWIAAYKKYFRTDRPQPSLVRALQDGDALVCLRQRHRGKIVTN
jgi:hypothetical protein